MTTTDVATIEPPGHQEAMRLQAEELKRTVMLLRSLDETSWAAATDCPGWDIRAMYQHVLGACEAGASIGENLRQFRRALAYRRQYGGPLEAALSAVQISDRASLTPAQILWRLESVAPKTVHGRARIPSLVRRHATLAIDGPVHEKWPLGYLIDIIYLRDLWMHRIDAARAAGQPPELTAGHDGRIAADIAAEWARRHGQPFRLDLTGPAGGSYARDADSPAAGHLRMDAVEFCRTLAGRAPATGLLTTVVPF